MVLVLTCIGLAYKTNSMLLDELLTCGVILTIVFVARMHEIIQGFKPVKKYDSNKNLTKTHLKKQQWLY